MTTNNKQMITLKTFLQEIKKTFEVRNQQLIDALPEHIPARKVISSVLSEVAKSADLQKCTIQSIYYAALQACRLGLLLNSLTAEAYLVPRQNHKEKTWECNFQAGYLGLLKLAYQSPLVKMIDVREIYENDTVHFIDGTTRKLEIQRPPFNSPRGKIVAYYAVAELKNGASKFEIMDLNEINEHKEKFALGWKNPGSTWQKQYDSMAKKTVLRKLLKFIPSSTEYTQLAEVVATDERNENGFGTENIIDGEFSEESMVTTKSKKVATALYEKYNKNDGTKQKTKKEEKEEQPDEQFLADMDKAAAEEEENKIEEGDNATN